MKTLSIRSISNTLLNSLFRITGLFQLFILRLNQNKQKNAAHSEFLQIYRKCRLYTLTEDKKLMSLYASVHYINENNIEGDFVECGVWRGGCCMLMALSQLKYKSAADKRKIYLYDTFYGMTAPGKKDPWFAHLFKGMGAVSAEEVKRNMRSTGYPEQNIVLVQGDVLKTIPAKQTPVKISLLRLDTDFYESTKHEMEQLFPLISRGGVLMIDDYYSFAGARKAVDEYLEQNNINLQFHDVMTGVIAYKE
jgi:O-methyltransferase